ncbi:MAG TPA: DsbA family oxidoreductase [Paludibacteraceae bacterium]|nr:DsbA family oxidoreductase [Paludibacteraceae bacterium]
MENKNNFTIKVEIWSDVVCPFCYIGKHKFEKALEKFPYKENVEVEWKSFQLDPFAITNPSLKTLEHLAAEKGWSMEEALQSTAFITQMAKEVGLEYHFEKAIVINSFKAHRLLHLAKKYGKQNEMEEKLFSAYFTKGKNIDDNEVLLSLAAEVGLDATETKEVLLSDAYSDEVKHDIAHARQLYVRGVPYFLFDDKFAVSGAQDESVFLQALNRALAERKKTDIIEFSGEEGGVCGPEGCEI